jgi:hypothetical protein
MRHDRLLLSSCAAAGACGGGGSWRTPDGPPGQADARPVDGAYPAPPGTIGADLRTDHVGWRTTDTKHVILLGHAGATPATPCRSPTSRR